MQARTKCDGFGSHIMPLLVKETIWQYSPDYNPRLSQPNRALCTWIHKYLATGKLPTHHYGQHSASILDDEDFVQDIQEHLQEIVKEGYIWAQDIVDYVSTPAIQEKLGVKK